jgi:hypothetical protein
MPIFPQSMKPVSAWLLRLPIKGLASYDGMIKNEFASRAEDRDRSLGFLVLRIYLGVNIGMHGVCRLAAGSASFSVGDCWNRARLRNCIRYPALSLSI